MDPTSHFLERYEEKGELNQYWYSQGTIQVLAKEVQTQSRRPAFLSTPSVFFCLDQASLAAEGAALLDADVQWAHQSNCHSYDFNFPEVVPEHLLGQCDLVIIDPPFITEDVWRKYAQTARLLLQKGGKVIATSIRENGCLLEELLGVKPQCYRPCIPNLIYQYEVFTNYPSALLSEPNPELPPEE